MVGPPVEGAGVMAVDEVAAQRARRRVWRRRPRARRRAAGGGRGGGGRGRGGGGRGRAAAAGPRSEEAPRP